MRTSRIRKYKICFFSHVCLLAFASEVTNAALVKKAASERAETYVRRLVATVCGSGNGGMGGGGKRGYFTKYLTLQSQTRRHNPQIGASKVGQTK